MEERIKTALEFLNDGHSFTVGGLRLGADKPGVMEVTGWSHLTNFANLTKRHCLSELEAMKALFYEMVNTCPELAAFIEARNIEFHLDFDDYGKGSIALCSEKGGKIIWHPDLN